MNPAPKITADPQIVVLSICLPASKRFGSPREDSIRIPVRTKAIIITVPETLISQSKINPMISSMPWNVIGLPFGISDTASKTFLSILINYCFIIRAINRQEIVPRRTGPSASAPDRVADGGDDGVLTKHDHHADDGVAQRFSGI